MYYGLKETTRLRKERECAVVFSVKETGNLRYVHPIYAVLLALCDGERRRQDLVQVLTEVFAFDPEKADGMVGKTFTDFADFYAAAASPFETAHPYDPADFLYKPEGDPHLRRLSGPISIAWLATERCPFDCLYCCIKTRRPTDRGGEMSRAQVLAFLEDCVATGVEAFTVHGGEPFLRKDLPELIGFLLARGVHVAVSTKLPLPEATVERLAAAGLPEVQVSVDSLRPEVADRLVGRPRYLEGALDNIRSLTGNGIRVRSNTVVTSHNVRQVPELVRRLAGLGVSEIGLSGYLRSFWKHRDSLLPDPEELRAMAAEVRALEPELPGVVIKMCPLESARDSSLASEGFSSCSGGRSGLVVGADGRVSICDRLVAFEDVVVGDVTRSTLAEIWNGEPLRTLLDPGRERFEGTVCAACSLFERCNRRMRCYWRTKMVDHRLFGPDYLCPVVPAPPLRFF